MANRHVHRYPTRRKTGIYIGAGCIVSGGLFFCVFTLAALYATGALLPLILGLSGADRVGNTESLFRDGQVRPTLVIADPVAPPNQAVVDLGRYGRETVNLDTRNYNVVASASGTSATASFSEAALLEICRQRTPVCGAGDGRLRNVSFDLKPGGMVIYAEANTGFNWQRLGVVMQVDPFTGSSFTVVGVDVGGNTYSPGGLPFGLNETVGDVVGQIENEGNAILRELVIQAGGTGYRLDSISVDETTLTLNLRG